MDNNYENESGAAHSEAPDEIYSEMDHSGVKGVPSDHDVVISVLSNGQLSNGHHTEPPRVADEKSSRNRAFSQAPPDAPPRLPPKTTSSHAPTDAPPARSPRLAPKTISSQAPTDAPPARSPRLTPKSPKPIPSPKPKPKSLGQPRHGTTDSGMNVSLRNCIAFCATR